MVRQYIKTGMITLLLSLFLVGITQAASDLETISVDDKTVPRYEVFDAVIEAVNHTTVSSQIAAEVVELNFDVNDIVPKGAVIMKLRDDEFQARVAQIQAKLSADLAKKREAIARHKEVAFEARRINNLFKRKLLAQAALDKSNANLTAMDARVESVLAQLKSRQAQLEEAKVQLSYTQIIAPYSGVVTERFIELGEMVSPGQHVMTGISLQQLRAVLNVPQYLFDAVRSAKLPVILVNGRQIQSEKMTINPHADVKSHRFQIRVDFTENREQISVYPGMLTKVKFMVGDEKIRVIPQTAIVQRSEVSAVYIITDDAIIFRQIRLGRVLEGGQREVLAGLSVGEQVAIHPLQALQLLRQKPSRSHP
ncbi:MAG: efflux RND transporter periplasmic adaptor subunit [Piscirickettsiaceae bacterium]|nr:efflux RND transporter periplasmic adaptor subunit [Piscirickettsiaceae bacterium]